MKGDTIPDGEFLYRYAKPESFPEDQTEVPHTIFEGDEEMSCDWERFQKAPELSIHIKEGKNVIIKIRVCDAIRNPRNPKQAKHPQPALAQKISHEPIKKGDDTHHPELENFSHSLVVGKKKILVQKALAENSTKFKVVDKDSLDEMENLNPVSNSDRIFSGGLSFSTIFFLSIIILIILLLIFLSL